MQQLAREVEQGLTSFTPDRFDGCCNDRPPTSCSRESPRCTLQALPPERLGHRNTTLVTVARTTGVHRERLLCRVVLKRFRHRNPARDFTYDLLEILGSLQCWNCYISLQIH